MARPKAAISWSGGRDPCAAYHRVRGTFHFVTAITMFNEDGTRSRSHGLRPEILAAQVERLGLHSIAEMCTWDSYDDAFDRALEAAALLDEFVARDVDRCGERGRYHTVVTSCEALSRPFRVRALGRATNSGCVAEDLVLDE